MELKDLVRVMTKEEFESAINEDIKFVERFKHFFKHDDVARIIEHVKSVLEASVDYCYPNHPEPKAEPGDMGEVSDVFRRFILTKKQNNMGFKIKKSIIYNMMNGSRVEYEFDNTKDFDYITFKGDGKESFSFNVILVKQLIATFEIMLQDIYSDNYKLKVYAGNCIVQLNANPKDSSESFFDVYDKDETKLIYGIEIGILKGMFGI